MKRRILGLKESGEVGFGLRKSQSGEACEAVFSTAGCPGVVVVRALRGIPHGEGACSCFPMLENNVDPLRSAPSFV